MNRNISIAVIAFDGVQSNVLFQRQTISSKKEFRLLIDIFDTHTHTHTQRETSIPIKWLLFVRDSLHSFFSRYYYVYIETPRVKPKPFQFYWQSILFSTSIDTIMPESFSVFSLMFAFIKFNKIRFINKFKVHVATTNMAHIYLRLIFFSSFVVIAKIKVIIGNSMDCCAKRRKRTCRKKVHQRFSFARIICVQWKHGQVTLALWVSRWLVSVTLIFSLFFSLISRMFGKLLCDHKTRAPYLLYQFRSHLNRFIWTSVCSAAKVHHFKVKPRTEWHNKKDFSTSKQFSNRLQHFWFIHKISLN